MIKRLFFVAVASSILLTCSGCLFARYVHVSDRYPVYDLPEKAQVAKISEEDLQPLSPLVRNEVVRTVQDLKVEAAQLRSTLKSYNEYARERNEKYAKLFEE